jgi:hypothetical protein
LAKHPEVGSNELFYILRQELERGLAEVLCRTVPLFDNVLDEPLLDDERVVSRKLSCTGSSSIKRNETTLSLIGKRECLLLGTVKHLFDINHPFSLLFLIPEF